ncbi:type 12 methyltransferase [Kordiimonas sediminis]|uniref:Type 12 methyltransferase n=1 Tax=Kordiimonas sediminis TaxID=1735581 RepID=A0A919AQE8_9PROT|nr:class I SAM-dependent methyltransferase [Kordiimonas sediminis]GHF19491.1 type 12 methyltransferase [Kordiimonas sediminis]
MITSGDQKQNTHTGKVVSHVPGHDIIDCQNCGFLHVSPLPTEAELTKLYQQDFYQSEKPEYIAASEQDGAWHDIEYGLRLDLAHEHLGHAGKVLDIGCGPGNFLQVARKQGWDAYGIEPSSVAADHAKSLGLDVQTGFFPDDFNHEAGSFDFIHMSEVLEHVPSPTEVIQAAKQLLRPDGVLTISVPNDFSPLQMAAAKAVSADQWWVVPDHHLNYFTMDSLEKILRAQCLTCIDRTTNFPMELFLLMGQDYTADPAIGKQCHQLRKKFDQNLNQIDKDLLKKFYRHLAGINMGRLAIITAQNGSE